MLMNRKRKSLDTLEARLKATAVSTDFNIVEDLEGLVRTYGVLKSKDYRKKLEAVLEKYKTSELTAIRNSVIKECEKEICRLSGCMRNTSSQAKPYIPMTVLQRL